MAPFSYELLDPDPDPDPDPSAKIYNPVLKQIYQKGSVTAFTFFS
jgi:hypothetical protein